MGAFRCSTICSCALLRAHYDDEHFFAPPVPFDVAEQKRTSSYLRAIEAALEDQAAVANAMVAMAQISLI